MGHYSGWEEEYDRKQYLKDEARYEAQRAEQDLYCQMGMYVEDEAQMEQTITDVKSSEKYDLTFEERDDLFRECTLEDPCGACPGCCQHEQGGEA